MKIDQHELHQIMERKWILMLKNIRFWFYFHSFTDWFFFSHTVLYVCVFYTFLCLLLRGSEKFSRAQFFENFSRYECRHCLYTARKSCVLREKNWQHFTLAVLSRDVHEKIPKRLFNEEFNFSSKFLRFDIGVKSVVLVVSVSNWIQKKNLRNFIFFLLPDEWRWWWWRKESASKQIYFIGSSYMKKITRRQKNKQCFFG